MSDVKINPQMIPGIQVKQGNSPKELNQKAPVDDTKYIPQQFKDVASSMEQQFVEMMLEQMEKTVDTSESADSAGMDFYRALQKSERAKTMTQQNNLGLQNMILDQIYPKRMRNEFALKQYEAQTNRIHQNLPSYKIDRKADTIEMGKNDSIPESDLVTQSGSNENGGL